MKDSEEDEEDEEDETPLVIEVAIDILDSLFRIFHPESKDEE